MIGEFATGKHKGDWFALLQSLTRAPNSTLTQSQIAGFRGSKGDSTKTWEEARANLAAFSASSGRARRIFIALEHTGDTYRAAYRRIEPWYSPAHADCIRAEIDRVKKKEESRRQDSGAKSLPAWFRLLELTANAEVEGRCYSKQQLIRELDAATTSQVAAIKNQLTTKLADDGHGWRMRFDVDYGEMFVGVSIRRMGFQRSLSRSLPRWAQQRIAPRLYEATMYPALANSFAFWVAALTPALWMILCRAMHWTYYLGGRGNEVKLWHSAVWGSLSAVPCVIAFVWPLLKDLGLRVGARPVSWFAAIAVCQTLGAGLGALTFYSLPIRNVLEAISPDSVRELLVASIWAALWAMPIVGCLSLFVKVAPRRLVFLTVWRVVIPVAALVAMFQALTPASEGEPNCTARLVQGLHGVFMEIPSGCNGRVGSRIVFDQVRGLLAGVALPFATLTVLLGVARDYLDRRLYLRAPIF